LVFDGGQLNNLGVLVRSQVVEEIVDGVNVNSIEKYFIVEVRSCG
jgi:hypothetical protein